MRAKRFIAAALSIIMILSLCLGYTMPLSLAGNDSQKKVFNAYDDYSTASNPNGAWSYQYRVLNSGSYVYTDLEKNAEGTAWVTDPKCGIYKTQGDKVTSNTNDVLQMVAWDQTHQAVLNFIAPYNGTIEVSMTNGGVFAPHNSADGVSFWFMKNNEVISSKTDLDNGYNAVANRYFSGTETLTVKQGDIIRFVVGRNAGVDGKTYFNPKIEYTDVAKEELPKYNAYNDYSTTSNPNGAWSYQYRVSNNGSYTYTDLGKNAEGTAWVTDPKCGIYKTQGDKVTSNTNDVLQMVAWDQTHQAVLNFIAPYSGTIEVSMTNGGVFAPHQGSDGVSFWFMKNNEVISFKTDLDNGYNAVANRYFSGTETLTVKQGDIIRFVVGRNAGVDGKTYLNPEIKYTEVTQEQSTKYNAYEDYSANINPNGVWSYQHLSNNTFTNLKYNAEESVWGAAVEGMLYNTTSDLVTGKVALAIRPEKLNRDVVLTFTAPYSGRIKVSMANGGVFAPHQSQDEITFTFKHNETIVNTVADLDSDYNASGNRFFTDTVELIVNQGDELHFIVHRNKQAGNSRVYFNPQIEYESIDEIQTGQETVITAVSPAQGATVQIVSDAVKEWMSEYDISKVQVADYMCKRDIFHAGQTILKWNINKEATSYVVRYATRQDMSDAKSIATTQNIVKINNLYMDTEYYWQVEAAHAGGTTTSEVFTFTTESLRRTVYIDGVSNTRDLGGIVNLDGVQLNQGLIYRGASADEITEDGKEKAIAELGIKTDLDLRTSSEAGGGNKSPMGATIQYINYNAPQYDLIAQYKSNIKNIIKVFADEDNYPIYYHCQVGRDRTGTVAVLLLGLLGVDKEQIYMDYELSGFSYAGTMDNANAEGLRESLDRLYTYLETYGKASFSENVVAFLKDCGITNSDIAEIRRIMLEDGGEVPEDLPSYNAYDDFSASKNPNGVWTYSNLSGGTYVDLTYDSGNNWWGTTAEGRLRSAVSDLVTGRPALEVRPELTTKDVVVTFTAPYSGIVKISMANGGVFAPHQSGDEIEFTMKHNETEVKKVSDLDNSYNTAGNRFFAEGVTRTVKAGDTIRFIVHRNKAVANPTTYFNPEIVYQAVGDDVLGFPADSEITVSKITTNGFTIDWPSACNGTGNYAYTVYYSETPFSGVPTDGGVPVEGNTYTFTNLEFGKSYYVAVVVDDGEYRVSLETPSAVKIFSDMFHFDAYEDFTKGSQNTSWQYLYTPIGTLAAKPLSWNGAHWGNQAQGTVERVDGDPVTGRKALRVIPGVDMDTIVAFTVPYTGTISVSMSNGGIYVPLNGAGDGYDGVQFTMQLNKEQKVHFNSVSSKNIHAPSVNPNVYEGRLFDGEYQMAVSAGDVLYFIVNKNANLHNDETFFNPVIEYTSVDESTLELRFCTKNNITASDVTKSSMTVNWPAAIGGTGEYKYTLYISDKPIKTIPANGGINMGKNTSYEMTGLPAYTSYYFAVVVSDGENQISLINTAVLSTIGNTYIFDSLKDYTTELQPISTPWRYYWQDVKTGKYTELTWDVENKIYGLGTVATLTKVESDLVTGKPALKLQPTVGKDAVVAFIAPYSGEITVDMSNGGVFAPYNGLPQNWDGINFTLKKGSEVLYSRQAVSAKNSHNDRCFAAEISLSVKKGEVLYFVVNSNNTSSMDSTYFAPRVSYTYVEQGSDGFGFLPGATVKATDVKKNGFTLNWSAVSGAVGSKITYKVWISTVPMKNQPASAPIYQGSQLKTICKNLSFARKYYVYIVAIDEAGNKAVLNPEEYVMTECPEYDAYKQFVKEKNEAGVWNYAVRTYNSKTKTYEYTLLSWSADLDAWGRSESGMIKRSEADPVTGLPAIYAHPGAAKQDAALVFTAPYSGTIRISMTNGGVYAPNNGADQNYDGINFMVYHGEKELWNIEGISAKHMAQGTRQGTDMIELQVKQGDKIYFLVGANKSSAADSTYFNPLIEYLEVTGGTGVIDKLEGFVIPEPDPVHLPSFRTNAAVESDGIAVMLKSFQEAVTPWLWISIYCGVILIMTSGIVICCVKLKRRK